MYQKSTGGLRKRADEESRDRLTGVLTKKAAETQIASRMREKHGGTLFLCSLDNIEQINGQHGYLTGDECLKQTARILSYMIRPNDILGRYSGAEFVVFMPDCQDAQQAEEHVQRIHNRFYAGREKGKIPISLTIAWALRNAERTCWALLARAEEEMKKLRAESEGAQSPDNNEKKYYMKDIQQVRRELLEQIEKPAAYCQDYEMFKAIYRFLARGIMRSGQKACVILITVTNKEGDPPSLYEKDVLMEQLGEIIGNTLRTGDVYARYSSCQYLLLVINTTKYQADLITDRIREAFQADGHKNDILIHRCFDLQPVRIEEADGESAGR